MSRIGNALASSIGKKAVMALTGLLLVGFLAEHLHGNLKLIEDPSGRKFEAYVEFLQGFGPLLTIAEIGLGLLFVCHVYLALRLTLENIQARRQRYQVRSSRGASTLGSISMFYSGALLLGFLIKHLLDFRFEEQFFAAPGRFVGETLSQPGHGVVYLLAAVLVGVHLSHGFRSALQTLGVNHPAWNPLLRKAGHALAALFTLGFGGLAIYFLFFWKSAP